MISLLNALEMKPLSCLQCTRYISSSLNGLLWWREKSGVCQSYALKSAPSFRNTQNFRWDGTMQLLNVFWLKFSKFDWENWFLVSLALKKVSKSKMAILSKTFIKLCLQCPSNTGSMQLHPPDIIENKKLIQSVPVRMQN